MIEVTKVYSTSDYKLFKKLKGNRNVLDARKRLLISSIKERGWIRNPIVCNEKMEIIDGQGRFEALKELHMPIEFVISPGATIQDCISLNIKQKNWSNQDYIDSYAENGVREFVVLNAIIKRYTVLNVSTICVICGNVSTVGAGMANPIKNGTFQFFDEENLHDRLNFAVECLKIIQSGNGRERTWATALKFIYSCRLIDNAKFLTQLSKRRAFISPIANTRQALEVFEKIYNYGTRRKVYFVSEYDKWLYEIRTKNIRRDNNESV